MKRKLEQSIGIGVGVGVDDPMELVDFGNPKRNLLQMEIEDFVAEKRLSPKMRKNVENLAEEIVELCCKRQEAVGQQGQFGEHEIWDTDELDKAGIKYPLRLPFGLQLKDIRTTKRCRWIPPTEIYVCKEMALGLKAQDDEAQLDLNITIPQDYFGSRDFLNFAYHVKRAHYVSRLAVVLASKGFEVRFGLEDHDQLRHTLIVARDSSVIHIHFSPPSDGFAKPSRFRPQNNNIRSGFCFGANGKLENEPSTPHYNWSILSDMLREDLDEKFGKFLADKPNLVNAIFMIRQWMKRRHFNERADGFSNTLLTAWLVWLYGEGKVTNSNTIIDVMVTFFKSLVSMDWSERNGISLSDAGTDTMEQMKLTAEYSFIFLDFSGYLNLAHRLSEICWANLQNFASLQIYSENLENNFNNFNQLFNEPTLFSLSFDSFIKMNIRKEWIAGRTNSKELLIKKCDNWLEIAIEKISKILQRALQERVLVFDFQLQPKDKDQLKSGRKDSGQLDDVFAFPDSQQKWDIWMEPSARTTDIEEHVVFGLRLLPGWDTVISRGPSARSSESKDFRQFWGEICELRKFADNIICEAIQWNQNSNNNSNYSIPFQICQYILTSKLKLKNCQFEEKCRFDNKGEYLLENLMERYNLISKTFEKLCGILRSIDNLPLIITNINPISAFLRKTSPYPPPSTEEVIESTTSRITSEMARPISRISPRLLETVEVQITMEQSGKWEENLEAIANLKMAFYNEMSKILGEKFAISAFPSQKHLLIIMDSVVFRILICYPREVHIMRKLAAGNRRYLLGAKDTTEVRLRELELIIRPSLAAHLHSISQQYVAYGGACRLALRWISSQMLSGYLEDIIIESIMAYVFLNPLPYQEPMSEVTAFARFLRLIATHNWLTQPLMVDLNAQWTEKDIDEIQENFIKMRPVLPAMVVCTPEDRSGCRWTRDEPQPVILKRLINLANNALQIIDHSVRLVPFVSFNDVLKPSEMHYDVLIYIRNRHHINGLESAKNNNNNNNNNIPSNKNSKIAKGDQPKKILPICDYNPIIKYINQLKINFNNMALFFYDKFRLHRIGIIWKPNSLLPKQPNVSNSLLRYMNKKDGLLYLNKSAILEDLRLLGSGLVGKIVSNERLDTTGKRERKREKKISL